MPAPRTWPSVFLAILFVLVFDGSFCGARRISRTEFHHRAREGIVHRIAKSFDVMHSPDRCRIPAQHSDARPLIKLGQKELPDDCRLRWRAGAKTVRY